MKKNYGLLIGIIVVVVVALTTFPRWRYGFGPTPRERQQRAVCIDQLRKIDAAKAQWAEQFHKSTNDAPSWTDLQSFLSDDPDYGYRYPQITNCPAGGIHTIGRIGQAPTCSIPGHELQE